MVVSGMLLSVAIIAGVAKLALALEVPTAVALPRLRPVGAPARGEHELDLLALPRAPLEDALRAHVGLAHDGVEARLLLLLAGSLIRGGGSHEQNGKELEGLHWMCAGGDW